LEDQSLVVVETYETEQEVLLAWTRLIQETDPDIIIGYNIFGFDFKFLYERSEELNCMEKFTDLGRFKELPQGIKDQQLSSSGLGENILYYIPMYGRVLADLYKIVQASVKLPMYGLNYVSKHFLYMSKNDMPPDQIFIKQKGTAADRRLIAEYCLIDCVLCNRLINKLDIITNNIGMSNVCMVPLSYLFLRGQGVKILSLVAMRCRQEGFLIPVLDKNDLEEEGYEGAIVLKPYSDIYFEPVVVCDFNSLYPSCMISENLSHDSYVHPGSKYDNLPGYEYVDIEYDLYREDPIPGTKRTNKVKCGVKVCRFVQLPDDKKSLLPRILQGLLKARKDTRKAQKAFSKGSFEWKVKEGLQLAYKITANSLYGQVGARTSAIYFKDIAACTTATGRKLIYFTKNFFESNYPGARAVYGDTDSVFIKFDCINALGNKLYGLDAIYKSIEYCMEGSLAISRQLKRPHNLEFEKAIWPFILITKKRYHGHYYTEYGIPKYYANSMGIVLKRRDNAPIVKHVFGDVVDVIMIEHDIIKAMNQAKEMAQELLEGKFPLEMFVITKTLRSYYKNPMQIAHNVLAQRIGKRDPGNKPQANDRIPYAYIRIPAGKEKGILQGDRIETPEYIKEHGLEIDYKFYLTNQIMKPVSQIFQLVTNDLASLFHEALRDYDYRQRGIRKITNWFAVKKIDKTQYANLNSEIQTRLHQENDTDYDMGETSDVDESESSVE
jgi:DNA polymerase delta subunit 1